LCLLPPRFYGSRQQESHLVDGRRYNDIFNSTHIVTYLSM